VDARLSTEVELSQALNTRECSKISSRKGREGVYLFANATVAKSRSSFFPFGERVEIKSDCANH